MAIYSQSGKKFRLLMEYESDNTWNYSDPVVFRMLPEGESVRRAFLQIQTNVPGTGNDNEQEFYEITRDGKLSEVEFDNAVKGVEGIPEELGVMKGVEYRVADDTLSFSFGLWREGDGNCCPTGGAGGEYSVKPIPGNPGKYRFSVSSSYVSPGEPSEAPEASDPAVSGE